MANTRRLSSLPKGSRDDCNQDGGNQDLGSEGEPETPLRCIADHCSTGSANYTDQNRDETPDGLHARNQDPSDKADNYSNKEATDEARDFHDATQPLLRPIGQVRRAEIEHENTFYGSRP